MTEERAERSRGFDFTLIAGAWSLLAYVAATLPLRNWDYWFHLTVGRLLATHHALPDKNVFGYSAPVDTSLLIHAWIGEYWLYELHQMGGLVATLLVRNLSGLAAWACIAWCVYRLTRGHAVVTAGVLLVGGLTFFAAGGFAGPQIFVFVVFGVLAVICTAALQWERGLWVVPLAALLATAFWANTSGNFWAPTALLGSFALAAQFGQKSRHRNFYIAGVVCSVAATFATPLGTGLFMALLNGTGAEAWLILGAPLALAPILPIPRIERGFSSVGRARIAVGLVLLAVAGGLAAQPWSDEHRAIPAFVFSESVRQTDPLRGYGPSNIPVEAVEVLKSWGSQPRVYAAPHLSGYILYEVQSPQNPQQIVWPVPDRAPTPEATEKEQAIQSDREVFRGVFQQMDIRAVIVTPELGPVGKFVASAPDWVEAGSWPSGALYVRERAPR